ncbi:MAG: T9SS type A sorting domain-containing protein [Bacteroidota bacterium]|nr:T9SS type A sorting domain-containing protein [Bacteroidota bacterium]MDP3146269.1 T9SS type A sorting domain-containing protein [Bacteroidota bacterium]
MKKNLLLTTLVFAAVTAFAQTPRLSLCEEFTGENCPPCASTNPGLNATLNANSAKIIAIKWQVAIPSAPSNTWSLYQTNKTEINIRSTYYAINSAPSGRIDGQNLTAFGASSDHAGNITTGLINTAQAITSPFSITMNRAWGNGCNSVDVTVTVQATQNYTASTNALKFRTVMVERLISFASAPGTNGEKNFEDVGIKSFPSINNGFVLPNAWVSGQTYTFAINCPIPSYTRNKSEIAFVGFIQNETNKFVLQAVRADKVPFPATFSLTAVDANVNVSCTSTIASQVTFQNNGPSALTSCTIIPFTDGIAGNTTAWSGNLAVNASTTIVLNAITTPTATGAHTFSYQIATSTPYYLINESLTSKQYLVASDYQSTPVSEEFNLSTFPPLKWTGINSFNSITWSREVNAGSFANTANDGCVKMNFFNNTLIGDVDELYLPPADLSGAVTPTLSFDLSKAVKNNENDQLDVLVSNDCGVTWTNVYSKAGQQLITTGVSATAFIPSLAQDWINEKIALTGFNSPNVLVKFKTTNDNGNNLYIDNINLSVLPLGVTKNSRDDSNISLYPNPANNGTTVKIKSDNASISNVKIINVIGQIIYLKQVVLNPSSNHLYIDTSDFDNGVYFVVIDSGKSSSIKKLIISK